MLHIIANTPNKCAFCRYVGKAMRVYVNLTLLKEIVLQYRTDV